MAFTQEEIKTKSISPFDHIESWADKADVISLIRLIDFLPILELDLVDELINRLTDKGVFRQAIKARLNFVRTGLDQVTKQVYKSYGYTPGKDSSESFLADYSFAQDAIQKLGCDILTFMANIERVTNVSKVMTEDESTRYIIENSTNLCKLNEGDTFFFIDENGTAVEYTFLSLIVTENDLKVKIKRISENTEFIEDNPWRPVFKTTLISQDTLEYFQKSFAKWKKNLIDS